MMENAGIGERIIPPRPYRAINEESVMEGLQRRRKDAVDNLAAFDAAIAILNDQPKLLETLNILRRVGV